MAKTDDRTTELSALCDVAALPGRPMSREKVAELILDKARSLLGNPLVLLYVYDAKAATFFPWAAMGVMLSRMTEVPLNHVLSLWDGADRKSVV